MTSIIPQRILFILPFAALIVCSAAARAEVQKFLHPCGGLQLCASYQMVLTPPEGWAVDEKASNENKIQIMVPNGQSFASAEPLIYAQVFYHADKQQTLGDFARKQCAVARCQSKIKDHRNAAGRAHQRQTVVPALCQ